MEEHEISGSDSNSMLSVAIGRVMNTLLSARPKKLEDAITRLSPSSKRASPVSLDESLWFLHNFVKDASEKDEQLDDVLIPMIDQSLKSNKSKSGDQSMILLNWVFQDELLFQSMARNLANIVLKKQDRYLTLGWCILVRGLLEYDISNSTGQPAKHGIWEKRNALLKSFTSCIRHLLSIVCSGSIPRDGHELPTRLSVSAADCILTLTESLSQTQLSPDSANRPTSSDPSASNQPLNVLSFGRDQKRVKSTVRCTKSENTLEMGLLVWDHLSELIILLQKLLAWSRKSRSMHAKGLEGVLKWLQELKGSFRCSEDEAGPGNLKDGVLLLSSCWKHYGMLLHLEDHRFLQHSGELLDQYISGIQFYTENCNEEISENNNGSSVETRKFFLNCIFLLLGRLGSKQLESTISEYGVKISQVLMSQLHCPDEDVIDGAVHIIKAIMFRRDSSSSGSVLSETVQMNAVLPLLLNLLDEQDSTARAAIMLTAEYCSIDDHCFREIMKRLSSVNVVQRKNSIDVVSEVIRISYPANVLSDSMWQEIAKHLLECMHDEEFEIRVQVSNLLPMIDPALVLPTLVRLVCSSSKGVCSHASDALLAVLKNHSERHEVICMLLDCLSNNFGQFTHLCKTSADKEDEFEFDTDHVLRLIPEWSKSVRDWSVLVGPLIDKMFAEPSNATIVRFLSYISEYLGDAADLVLHHVLLHTKEQEDIGEMFFSQCEIKTMSSSDPVKFRQALFDRLCPLLVIRLLPLRSFDNIRSPMYGEPLNENMYDFENSYRNDKCVAALLFDRAFGKFEFEDVRKLAAELCGRIHPQVLLPIISAQLDQATSLRDMLKIKACLFSMCNSLVVRSKEAILHPDILKIRKAVECILLWHSLDGDEVSKAQHGCIDCLALMIYAELQVLPSTKNSSMSTNGDAVMRHSFIAYIIRQLTYQPKEVCSGSKLDRENCMDGESLSLPFRLCMANVLISACQKITDSCRKPFAQETLPSLIHSIRVIADSEIRAACIQVLFSAVYHLKSAVVPHALELFKISVKALRKGSDKEKVAGAKLMASLMASEDAVIRTFSSEILKARAVLSTISRTDSSMTVREVCEKLLGCVTSS